MIDGGEDGLDLMDDFFSISLRNAELKWAPTKRGATFSQHHLFCGDL